MGHEGTPSVFLTFQNHCFPVLNSPEKKTLTVLHDSLEHKPWCAISEIREHSQSLLCQGAPDRFTLLFYTRSSLEGNQETSNSKLVFSLLNNLSIKSIHHPCFNNELSKLVRNIFQIPKRNCVCWLFDNSDTSRVDRRQISWGNDPEGSSMKPSCGITQGVPA